MKITPLEIRQKTFEKKLRGYDKEAVDAYLQSLSQEWERLQTENRELKARLETSERDVQKLREVEASLFKTLKTAEDTGANMVEQAQRTSQLYMKEAQMNAESILTEAKNMAKALIEEAEEAAREALGQVKDQVRNLEMDYREIEDRRENLLHDLRIIANDTLEKVDKIAARRPAFKPVKTPDIQHVVKNVMPENKSWNVKSEKIIQLEEEIKELERIAEEEEQKAIEVEFEVNTSFNEQEVVEEESINEAAKPKAEHEEKEEESPIEDTDSSAEQTPESDSRKTEETKSGGSFFDSI